MGFKKIFIAGSGAMGLEFVQLFAANGFDIIWNDLTDDILKNSMERLSAKLDREFGKGKIDLVDKSLVLSRIKTDTSLRAAKDCDLVLESITEAVEIKKKLFRNLDRICGPNTIFATNTSSISITLLASATKRADRFIGTHFFNPPTVMRLVEVVRGISTSEQTVKQIFELCHAVNKTPVDVKNETPGFLVNKILVPMINEAICILDEGIASAREIDDAMKYSAGHPMGPLALSDMIGNDIILNVMDMLHQETGDSKYRASTLLRKMVRCKRLGRKTGIGFYHYSINSAKDC